MRAIGLVFQVAGLVHIEDPGKEVGGGFVANGNEQSRDVQLPLLAGFVVDRNNALNCVFTEHILHFGIEPVSYTHLRAHETVLDIVCRLLLDKKKQHTP